MKDQYFPKAGDFVNFTDNFGDSFYEVLSSFTIPDSKYWSITFVKYDKRSNVMRTDWKNSASEIRQVIPAEFAEPIMKFKCFTYYAQHGKYDPFTGFIKAFK